MYLSINYKSCEIAWSFSRGEIFIGNKDGSITIWCAKKKSPICNSKL